MTGVKVALGLARLPRRVAELLDDAAANAIAVAIDVVELASDPARAAELRERIARSEEDGDRITRDLHHGLGYGLLTGAERRDLLGLAQHVDDVLDAFDDLAHQLALDAATFDVAEKRNFA